MNCDICCEKFNKSTRKIINCSFCNNFNSCSTCTVTYILNSIQDPHCMNCKHAWDREFMDLKFTKTFMNNEYKNKRKDLLFQIEKSLMPSTQNYAEHKKNTNEILKDSSIKREKINEIKKELDILGRSEYENIYSTIDITEKFKMYDNISELSKIISNLETDIITNNKKISLLNNIYTTANGQRTNITKNNFIRACPGDNCKGFLSTRWKCGLCKIRVCSKCHEIKEEENDDDENIVIETNNEVIENQPERVIETNNEEDLKKHKCKPENVESAKLIAKDSKACPKCASMIFKIDGCNQMWCTQCHIAFDWRTGKIETGTVHNPHWYQFLRENNKEIPRNIGDIPGGGINCNGLPTYNQMNLYLKQLSLTLGPLVPATYYYKPIPSDSLEVIEFNNFSQLLWSIHREHGHISNTILRIYQTYNVNIEDQNLELRADYMINILTEKEFKSKLQQKEKITEKNRAIRWVLEMLLTAMNDILYRVLNIEIVNEAFIVLKEVQPLKEYTNNCMIKISKRFNNCVVPLFDFNSKRGMIIKKIETTKRKKKSDIVTVQNEEIKNEIIN